MGISRPQVCTFSMYLFKTNHQICHQPASWGQEGSFLPTAYYLRPFFLISPALKVQPWCLIGCFHLQFLVANKIETFVKYLAQLSFKSEMSVLLIWSTFSLTSKVLRFLIFFKNYEINRNNYILWTFNPLSFMLKIFY